MARLWLCSALFLVSACGTDPCGDETGDESGDAPHIEDLELLDDVSALESDPWTVVLAARFKDADGDLGDGSAVFFLQGEATDAVVALPEIFRQSGIPLTATQGRIAMPLRFSEGVEDGAKVWLGTQLVDASNRRSNCYGLEIEFSVKAAK